jgi:hypothetical protein
MFLVAVNLLAPMVPISVGRQQLEGSLRKN